MQLDKNRYQVETMTLEGETIHFRAFRELVYVDKPQNEAFQTMNIFVPEVYFNEGKVNGYTANTVPIFMPNTVGGYQPGNLAEPGYDKFKKNKVNAIFRALQHGYVVAVPAIRGRSQKNEKGEYNGKAPACIVDYKAAVRYLRYFKGEIPGDTEKIITNGTSAGGALSALMGATGNVKAYEPYLEEMGAAKERDDVFAASCYCPITNLEHADMAYEWQFNGIYEYHRKARQIDEAGRPFFTPVDGTMSDQQIRISKEEAALFPHYLNSLKLKSLEGEVLTLDEEGNGSFKEYVKMKVLESAQEALDQGIELTDKKWLVIKEGQAVDMDFVGYAKDITRMKTAPAFDDVTMLSPENNLFGTTESDNQHFTTYSYKNSQVDGKMAEEAIIKLMNPMCYIGQKDVTTAKHWRIRHGECDRDTSLAISAMLTLLLENQGCHVDYHLPWNMPHAGDYDLEELFKWIDSICK